MTALKAIALMLLFLILAAGLLYGVSLLAEWPAGASRVDSYNIKVRTITYGEVER